MRQIIHLTPGRIVRILVLSASVVLAGHAGAMLSTHVFGYEYLMGLVPLFHLKGEWNVPAVYSSALLMLSALLLTIIAAVERGGFRASLPWAVLAAIFAFLSIDELFGIHEKLSPTLQQELGTGGALTYAWTIPCAAAVLLLSALYLRWFLAMPRRERIIMGLSAAAYLSGALGVEWIEGWAVSVSGKIDLFYELLVTVEESLEIAGVILFIYALLIHVERRHDGVQIIIAGRRDARGKEVRE